MSYIQFWVDNSTGKVDMNAIQNELQKEISEYGRRIFHYQESIRKVKEQGSDPATVKFLEHGLWVAENSQKLSQEKYEYNTQVMEGLTESQKPALPNIRMYIASHNIHTILDDNDVIIID